MSVPVISLGTNIFPAFFTNDSKIKSPYTVDHENDIAKMMQINQKLNISSGMIVAAPNPNPGESVLIQSSIDQALQEATDKNIYGASLTPFILARVQELTKGIFLIYHYHNYHHDYNYYHSL